MFDRFPIQFKHRKIISNAGGKFIGRTPFSNSAKRNLVVKCLKHDHTWTTKLSDLNRGIWCKYCAIDNKTINHEQIKNLVESKNGILITKDCSSSTKK